MTCMLGGQRAAAEWLAEHPGWRLDRWRCEIDHPKEGQA
jgi:hypothetical protein